MSMTMNDLDALNRAHDGACQELNRRAVAIAESVLENRSVKKSDLKAYEIAKLGVESTRRDLEYCMGLALAELYDK